MAKRGSTPPLTPDERVIKTHMELVDADMSTAKDLMEAATTSAEEARGFAGEFPAVRTKANKVVNKVAAMATEFSTTEEAYRDARIAAAGGNKPLVERKATDVSNYLGRLKKLDDERKKLFDAASKATEEKRFFKVTIEEIEGIHKGIQNLLTKATERETEAREAVNEARGKLPVGGLSGYARTAADKAQSLTPSVKEAENNLHSATDVVTTLTAHRDTANTALTAANNAATANDKAAAETALESAKVAKGKADKVATGAGIVEKEDGSQPTPQPPTATGGHGGSETTTPTEQDSVEQLLDGSFWGRMFILLLLGAAILVLAPEEVKWILGVAWILLVAASVAPAVRKSRKWKKAFWAITVGLLVLVLVVRVSPIFGPNPIEQFFGGNSSGQNHESEAEEDPAPEDCRPGWFDDPCAD